MTSGQTPEPSSPEHFTSEPEIVPPGAPLSRQESLWSQDRVWSQQAGAGFGTGSSRLFIVRPGPLTTILWLAALGAILIGVFLLVLGTMVVLLPAAGILLAAFVVATLLRRTR